VGLRRPVIIGLKEKLASETISFMEVSTSLSLWLYNRCSLIRDTSYKLSPPAVPERLNLASLPHALASLSNSDSHEVEVFPSVASTQPFPSALSNTIFFSCLCKDSPSLSPPHPHQPPLVDLDLLPAFEVLLSSSPPQNSPSQRLSSGRGSPHDRDLFPPDPLPLTFLVSLFFSFVASVAVGKTSAGPRPSCSDPPFSLDALTFPSCSALM